MKRKILTILIIVLLISGPVSAEPWNVLDITYKSSQTLPATSAGGIAYADNGTKAYLISDESTPIVYQYSLSTPYDFDNAIEIRNKTFPSIDGVRDIAVKEDGSKLIIAGNDPSGTFWGYDFTTNYNINTTSLDDTTNTGNSLTGIWVNGEGTTIVTGDNSADLAEYTLSSSYDIGTLSNDCTLGISGPFDVYLNNSALFWTTQTNINSRNTTSSGTICDGLSSETKTANYPSETGFGYSIQFNPSGELLTIYDAGDNDMDMYILGDAFVSGYIKDNSNNGLEEATVSTNTSQTTITDSEGFYSIVLDNGDYIITANKTNYVTNSTNITVSGTNIGNINITLIEKGVLELDIRTYQEHGSTQSYTVTVTKSDGTTDITNIATVTSGNTSVITIDTVNNKLVATSDVTINERVIITAEYQGDSITKNVTVANRTIENIDIMPPNQWIPTVLGIDEEGLIGGIGSEFQWILFSIIIMTGITVMTNNAYVGIGFEIILIFLLWVIDYVGISILLSVILFGLFIGFVAYDSETAKIEFNNYR